jgi:hypothetical protein
MAWCSRRSTSLAFYQRDLELLIPVGDTQAFVLQQLGERATTQNIVYEWLT